jgi:hypothetical protein
LLFTAIGLYLGISLLGADLLAVVPTCAGTAGGFLLAAASWHVWERTRRQPARAIKPRR